MSEVNLGQFIKNVFDYSTGKQPAAQSGKVAHENFQNAQNELVKQVNQTVQNLARNFVQQQDVMMTQMQLKELTQMERAMLLKSLFDFPSNIKDIAQFLATESKAISAKELQLLMSQPMDISKLIVLLQTNGKNASDKIAKMIATMHQSGIYDTKQLKEMATIINACIPAADAPASQVLKSFMIMYLPWLPISSATEFNFTAESEDEKKSSEGEDSISILITTKNYGLVKIFLFKDEGKYNIDINCNEEFPKDKFNSAIKLSGEDASVNINEKIVYTTRKVSDEDKKEEAKVDFSKSAKVSPQLLIVIHAIIKIVMEIDSQGVVDEARKFE